jgi:hypothetical protein
VTARERSTGHVVEVGIGGNGISLQGKIEVGAGLENQNGKHRTENSMIGKRR